MFNLIRKKSSPSENSVYLQVLGKNIQTRAANISWKRYLKRKEQVLAVGDFV